MQKNVKEMAVTTLLEIWTCIDWDKTDKKRLIGIWDEFTNKVKATASTTNDYNIFVEKLCRKMGINSLRYKQISEISETDDKVKAEILQMFRENTRLVVLELRLNREITKEQRELEKQKQGGIENV
jgi:hypothetical protein